MSKKTIPVSQKRLQRSLRKVRRYLLATKLMKISSPAYNTNKTLSIIELSCYSENPKTNKRRSLLNSCMINEID